MNNVGMLVADVNVKKQTNYCFMFLASTMASLVVR